MCIACVEIMNSRMTLNEAKVALEELIRLDDEDNEHYKDLYLGIIEDILNDKNIFDIYDESHKKDGIKCS